MDTMPLMLLALHMLALSVVTIIFIAMIVLHRRARSLQQTMQTGNDFLLTDLAFTLGPTTWLAVRSSNPKAVQTALGIGHPTPCSWREGITGGHDFFIGSPINNWIIVISSSLPQPGHDVDRCFHFLIRLSRVLGQVQFFTADPVLNYHAWVRAEGGVVKRAYAWAGKTVWNQGAKSLAEMELNMKCFGYGDEAATNDRVGETAATNVKKVPSLAARWSINPMAVDGNLQNHADGIAGRSSLFCQD